MQLLQPLSGFSELNGREDDLWTLGVVVKACVGRNLSFSEISPSRNPLARARETGASQQD